MYDPVAILNSYTVVDGVLYRKLLNGTMRRVLALHGGRLVVTFEGRRVLGTDIAWLCHHFFPCPHPTTNADGDPHNMHEHNVVPVRRRRLVFRPVAKAYGYKHALNKVWFSTAEAARQDWKKRATEYYSDDLALTLARPDMKGLRGQIVEAVAASKPAQLARSRRFKPEKKHVPRPAMPDVPEGMECHWYKDQWVVIPMAVHCSDDWMVRADACLENPQARFRYDPTLERTVLA